MGLYMAEAGRVRTASIDRVDEAIDVFISYKSEDVAKAEEVARCINIFGLTVWLDVVNLAGEDNETMVGRIDDAISKSASLMAIVTGITNESWWVPFEIGLAYDKRKLLASYCENQARIDFPSFLWRWPLVKNHRDLHTWCERVKSTKRTHLELYIASETTRGQTSPDARRQYLQTLSRIKHELNRN